MEKKVLTVLALSGGLDSLATANVALENGYDLYAVNFYYNQDHDVERICYKALTMYLKAKFPDKEIIMKEIDLTNVIDEFKTTYQEVKEDGTIKELSSHKYYVPSRNLLFSVILSVIGELYSMKTKGYDEIKIGLGIHKHSQESYGTEKTNYWDITEEFANKLNDLLSLNDVVKISVFAPFVDKTKEDIVRYVAENKLPYNLTWSCYSPVKNVLVDIDGPFKQQTLYFPCNECEACKERLNAGIKAGVHDINSYCVVV